MIYGRGDHLVDHLSRLVQTMPLFATVGFRDRPIRPVPVSELVDVVVAAAEGRLSRQTVSVVGAETLTMGTAVRRIAAVLGRPVAVIPAPVWALQALGRITERTMHVPLVAVAQVRMLAEGVSEPSPPAEELPPDLRPRLPFDGEQILDALPDPGGFTVRDLRLPGRASR
jgi:NADH dehydrogenase